jgi:hypothetical protein
MQPVVLTDIHEKNGIWVQHGVELHPGFSVKILFGIASQGSFFTKRPKPINPEWPGWLAALRGRWPNIRPNLEEAFAELARHADKGPTTWSHIVSPSLTPFSDEEWELGCNFSWQTAEDSHLYFRFHLVGDRSQGVSIDT